MVVFSKSFWSLPMMWRFLLENRVSPLKLAKKLEEKLPLSPHERWSNGERKNADHILDRSSNLVNKIYPWHAPFYAVHTSQVLYWMLAKCLTVNAHQNIRLSTSPRPFEIFCSGLSSSENQDLKRQDNRIHDCLERQWESAQMRPM